MKAAGKGRRSMSDDLCVRCGTNPRPWRTNWEAVNEAQLHRDFDWPDDKHHLCPECYQADRDRDQQEAIEMGRSAALHEARETPSKRLVKGRKAHECGGCGGAIPAGTVSWRCVTTDRRTVKVCCTCLPATP